MKPEDRIQYPKYSIQNPESRIHKPDTRDQKPETRNQRPETRNKRPETINRKTDGFTLMEVLVALVIIGIAVTYIIQLFSVNLGSISASDGHVAAVMRAESRMRQVLDDDQLKEQSFSEVTDDGYRMDVKVSDLLTDRTEDLQVKLVEVDLTVHWMQGSKEKALTLSTLKVVDKL